jgi:hypothetical protein
MLFDRILEDSLGFIRRKLWSEHAEASAQQPFKPTQSIDGEFGIIHLLSGRDTPRAVRTWMYTPKRQHLNAAQMVATAVPMDLHIYLDFLGPFPHSNTPSAVQEREARASQRKRGLSVATHRLQLLKASHFLNADGFYNCEVIFWQDRDFYPPAGSNLPAKMTDKIAIRCVDALAFKCLEMANPLKVKSEDWADIVEEVYSTVRAKVLNSN